MYHCFLCFCFLRRLELSEVSNGPNWKAADASNAVVAIHTKKGNVPASSACESLGLHAITELMLGAWLCQ